MVTILEKELKRLENLEKHTFTDGRQFIANVEAEYKKSILKGHIKLLNTHLSFIGKEVYKYQNNFKYTSNKKKQDILNKIDPTPIKFTRNMYYDFEFNLASFFVEKLTTELLEHSLFSNSTSLIQNAKNQVIIESKQDLLKLYKIFSNENYNNVEKNANNTQNNK
jgi:hypothetical protein